MLSLFKPGAKINQDHKHKYIHILAYAASVVETWKKVRIKYTLNYIYIFIYDKMHISQYIILTRNLVENYIKYYLFLEQACEYK